MNMKNINLNKIFRVASNAQEVICPPDLVFNNPDFELIVTVGGDLVEDEQEFDRFRAILTKIGESEFYIRENLGATITSSTTPFQTTIRLKDRYDDFRAKVNAFDPPYGWSINHFYINGQKENWGIYICEFPAINIIGCDPLISSEFKKEYSLNPTEYQELKSFIGREFANLPNHLNELFKNYNLK